MVKRCRRKGHEKTPDNIISFGKGDQCKTCYYEQRANTLRARRADTALRRAGDVFDEEYGPIPGKGVVSLWYDPVIVDRAIHWGDAPRPLTGGERYEVLRRVGHLSNEELAAMLGLDIINVVHWRQAFAKAGGTYRIGQSGGDIGRRRSKKHFDQRGRR